MKAVATAITLLTGLLMCAVHAQQARVSVQYIELPHSELTQLLAESTANGLLHSKAMELVRASKARIVETNIVVCRSGEKAAAESIREEIFPTETEPPALPGSIGLSIPSYSFVEIITPQQRAFTAFETRNTGVTLEVAADVLDNGSSVQLRLTPEMVSRDRLATMTNYRDKRGDASLRMPVYETWRSKTSLNVRAGTFTLAAVFHPKPQPSAPFADSRILLFVRADVLE